MSDERQRALQLRWDSKVPGFANLRDDNVTTWYSTMCPRNSSRAWDEDEALSSKAIAVRAQILGFVTPGPAKPYAHGSAVLRERAVCVAHTYML